MSITISVQHNGLDLTIEQEIDQVPVMNLNGSVVMNGTPLVEQLDAVVARVKAALE